MQVSKEWFEKMAALEGDSDPTTGKPDYLPGFVPSAADRYYNRVIAKMGVRITELEAALSAAPHTPGMKDLLAHGRILLANLDHICDLTGEQPEDEDAVLVAAAREAFGRAPPDDDLQTCIACEQALKAGDLVYNDASGDLVHAACCGPERESYTGKDGGPLKDGEPIPEPWPWSSDDTPALSEDTPAGWAVQKKQGDGIFLSAEEYDEASAAAEAAVYGCGYFAVYWRQPAGGNR